MKWFIILLLIFNLSCSKMELLTSGMITADGLQTLELKNYPHLHETNKFMGKYPHEDKIIGYFITYFTMNIILNKTLKGKWLKLWQAYVIGEQGTSLYKNHKLGIRIGK